jgi:hypothetical protein
MAVDAGLAHGEQHFVGQARVEKGTEHRRFVLRGGGRLFRRLAEHGGNQA